MTIRVLLVDDDPLVRTGLRLMLGGAGDLEVVGELADGAQVPGAVRELAPDVVLMDIRMPVVDGIEATRELAARAAGDARARVIVLTTFGTDRNVLAAMRAGAAGFLLKHTEPEEIVESVRRAARGEPAVSPAVVATLMAHAAADSGAEESRRRFRVLTERERAVAAAVAEGLSNSEIAGRLHLSAGTVKTHISSALAKLGLDNRIQLAIVAHEAGTGR
ncbi:response regulator transcription factor [Streptomyces sodiiphilus]|uniref:Response regulator transcription factor n=1 Tax=Streptomyces sodiiphilus TaxID=226217 RepID=A0ABN2NQS6_9ACTN